MSIPEEVKGLARAKFKAHSSSTPKYMSGFGTLCPGLGWKLSPPQKAEKHSRLLILATRLTF